MCDFSTPGRTRVPIPSESKTQVLELLHLLEELLYETLDLDGLLGGEALEMPSTNKEADQCNRALTFPKVKFCNLECLMLYVPPVKIVIILRSKRVPVSLSTVER